MSKLSYKKGRRPSRRTVFRAIGFLTLGAIFVAVWVLLGAIWAFTVAGLVIGLVSFWKYLGDFGGGDGPTPA